MIGKYRKQLLFLGLIFTIASALATVALTWIVYSIPEFYARMLELLYDLGMDTMGALICEIPEEKPATPDMGGMGY